MTTVAVCIPTIPPRATTMLPRALASMCAQTRPPDELHVVRDVNHDGAWVTRTRALNMATTDWVAFLDDDDEFMPQHIEHLLAATEQQDTDYVCSYYEFCGVPGGFEDPELLGKFGGPFDVLNKTGGATVLVRTKLAQSIGFTAPKDPRAIWSGEDRRFVRGLAEAGARFLRLNEVTWKYHSDSKLWQWPPSLVSNTGGMPQHW